MSITFNPLTNPIWALPSLANAGAGMVAQSTDAGLVQDAVDLSSDAGVIAQLGVPNLTLPTYNAAGLFDQLVLGDTAPAALTIPAAGTDTQSIIQQLADSALVDTLAFNSVASGIYTSTGTLQNTGLDANWAGILQSDANFAGTVAADTFAQSIVGTFIDTIA